MGRFRFPPEDDNRTAASLGLLGKTMQTWIIRGMRETDPTAVPPVEQVWQGPTAFPVLPVVGGTLTAVSSVAADDAAGVGARRLQVIYCNFRGELREARGDMAGIVPAPMFEFDQVTQTTTATAVVDAFRVIAVNVIVTGTSGINDGIIDISIGADIQARIPRTIPIITTALRCVARPGSFFVPTGFCAVLDTFDSGSGLRGANVEVVALQARFPRMPWQGVFSGSFGEQQIMDHVTFGPLTDLRLVYEQAGGASVFLQPKTGIYLYPDATSRDSSPEQIPNLNTCTWQT